MASEETCPCRLCGKPTLMLGTKLCDAHWELERRVLADPVLARRILETDSAAAVALLVHDHQEKGLAAMNSALAATQAGALQAVGDDTLVAWGERNHIGADPRRLRWAYEDAISLAATQPNAAPAAEVVAGAEALLSVFSKPEKAEPYYTDWLHRNGYPGNRQRSLAFEYGFRTAWRLAGFTAAKHLTSNCAAPAAAIDAREQEAEIPPPSAAERGLTKAERQMMAYLFSNMGHLTDAEWRQHGFRRATFDRLEKKLSDYRPALASRSESPAARPNAAGQEQGEQ